MEIMPMTGLEQFIAGVIVFLSLVFCLLLFQEIFTLLVGEKKRQDKVGATFYPGPPCAWPDAEECPVKPGSGKAPSECLGCHKLK